MPTPATIEAASLDPGAISPQPIDPLVFSPASLDTTAPGDLRPAGVTTDIFAPIPEPVLTESRFTPFLPN